MGVVQPTQQPYLFLHDTYYLLTYLLLIRYLFTLPRSAHFIFGMIDSLFHSFLQSRTSFSFIPNLCPASELLCPSANLITDNNNNGYLLVLSLQRAHSPVIKKKRCEHKIRKNQQIKSTMHDNNNNNCYF